ncbi:hypothetical protein DSUL_20230 [Desulfovibrionales bacterium]
MVIVLKNKLRLLSQLVTTFYLASIYLCEQKQAVSCCLRDRRNEILCLCEAIKGLAYVYFKTRFFIAKYSKKI